MKRFSSMFQKLQVRFFSLGIHIKGNCSAHLLPTATLASQHYKCCFYEKPDILFLKNRSGLFNQTYCVSPVKVSLPILLAVHSHNAQAQVSAKHLISKIRSSVS